MDKDKLYFQDEPSTELADKLKEFGEMIKERYDEPIFGEFILTQALNYKTGIFQQQWKEFNQFMEEIDEEEIFDNIDFDNIKIQ
jgi:hypothetical protein